MKRAILGAVLLSLLAGCSPDAPHDNPYDVPQTGINGTTYARNGGALPGVVITVSPASITASSDGSGRYSLELTPSSRQVLQFSKTGYQISVDTVTVPDRGMIQHNVILYGQPTVDTAVVRTVTQRLYNGSMYYYIQPYLVVHHPDGQALLDDYTYHCQIDTTTWTLVEVGARGNSTKLYSLNIDHIIGVADFHGYIPGHLARFMISSASFSSLTGNKVIPAFLEPAPENLAPANGAPFVTPNSLQWTNGLSNVNFRIEVYNGLALAWSCDTTNVSSVFLPLSLPIGNYSWKVIARDINGNQAQAEATFTGP